MNAFESNTSRNMEETGQEGSYHEKFPNISTLSTDQEKRGATAVLGKGIKHIKPLVLTSSYSTDKQEKVMRQPSFMNSSNMNNSLNLTSWKGLKTQNSI